MHDVIKVTDQEIVAGRIDLTVAIGNFAAEHTSNLLYEEEALHTALKEIAVMDWQSYNSLLEFQQVLSTRNADHSEVLQLAKNPARFTAVVVDVSLNSKAYTDRPATLFVFDELARIYHEHMFIACINAGLPVYWSRTESRRNRRYARSSITFIAEEPITVEDIEKVLAASSKYALGNSEFQKKLWHYLEGFTAIGDQRLESSYMRFYKDYGLLIGKEALKRAFKQNLIGDIQRELSVKIRSN